VTVCVLFNNHARFIGQRFEESDDGLAFLILRNGLLSVRGDDIHCCMSTRAYPLRLSVTDRRLFQQSARAEKMTLAQWLRNAGRERAARVQKREWACRSYPAWELSENAERDKHYVSRKLRGRT
jgi:hypothetical protein